MNTTFTRMFHKSVVTSIFVFGFTTLSVMAQSAPQSPPNTRPPTAAPTAAPTTAPAQPPAAPAVANQNPTAPVRSAPAQEPANGQVGNNPLNTNQSIPNSQFMKDQNAVPTSQTGNTAGVGYNNPGGIVNSAEPQSTGANQVHYHYHYDSAGQPSATTPTGYAKTTYVNPNTLNQSPQATNRQSSSGGENSEYNYALNNDEGGMYQYQTNNWNPNSKVGNGGGAGVRTTWNPLMGNGAGMLTYNGGGGGGIEGFND